MTNTEREQAADFVVPDRNTALVRAWGDQRKMMVESDLGDRVIRVSACKAAKKFWFLICFIVNVDRFLVAVNDLLHLVFPYKLYIDNLFRLTINSLWPFLFLLQLRQKSLIFLFFSLF